MEIEQIDSIAKTNTLQNTIMLRKTKQEIMPPTATGINRDSYDIYPAHELASGKIQEGFSSLATWIAKQETVIIDGYIGLFWDRIATELRTELEKQNIKVNWYFMQNFIKPEAEIDQLVSPFLGTENSVWGIKTSLELIDFYQVDALADVPPLSDFTVNILLGTGAALCGWEAPIIYIDLPKNELQYRMNAGTITNLGKSTPEKPATMYKRFYFVDWQVCNRHKQSLLQNIDVWVDGQGVDWITWTDGATIRAGLNEISQSAFRPRPWFTPGSWGGQWIKKHMPQLNQKEPNYAWSFELIAPENGLVFKSDDKLLEISFDCLMALAGKTILGKHHPRFGNEFPIRFDFLDTFEGGNLSIQCHPSLAYIQEHFGETITQDETYYILDCAPEAKVFLGFQDDIDPVAFRLEIENSLTNNKEIDIEKYVQSFPSKKHELFLIPSGTVHSSGKNNLVLEISATPYIFTFKIYDWLSRDLDGNPRPINIEHAFNNLKFERKGALVSAEHISKPAILEEGEGWRVIHIPTHQEHFYDVHRLEFTDRITVQTEQACHVMMLVEGNEIMVRIGATETCFHFAETFVIPADITQYTLINRSGVTAKVIKAFVKDEYGTE